MTSIRVESGRLNRKDYVFVCNRTKSLLIAYGTLQCTVGSVLYKLLLKIEAFRTKIKYDNRNVPVIA